MPADTKRAGAGLAIAHPADRNSERFGTALPRSCEAEENFVQFALVARPDNRYVCARAGNGPRAPRRGGRVVECTALEMRHGCKPIGGSNPSLSASSACHAIAFIGFSQILLVTNPQFTPHFSWILVDYIVALARHRP